MTSSRLTVAGATAIFLSAFAFTSMPGTQAQEPEGNFGVGIPDVFLPKYLNYRSAQLASPTPDVLRVPLGYVKGLSTSFTSMSGEASINLVSGSFSVNLNGLTPFLTYTAWLVDRSETGGLIPLVPDLPISLVSFLATGPTALLSGLLPALPLGMTIDRVVVAPGILPGGEALAAGTVNVFQKIFFRRLSIENASTGALMFFESSPPPPLFAMVPDVATETDSLPAFAAIVQKSPPMLALADLFAPRVHATGNSVKLDKLISQGADLFFNGTFGGNGRTCGTCHPANNNFTIEPAFIATRPANDPLFVAEFNPALANLEKPQLMRQFGLILENLDGFSNPVTKFVMRGVPHTLGLQVSLQQDPAQPNPPAEMTGWSGDGAPGTGSLREFAIGAVTQHFTKSLNRFEGPDFKLPKEHQLDALEAFQLSLGREKDFDLTKVTFTDANVNTGENLFVNGGPNPTVAGGKCAGCHGNAGALAATGVNLNVNTNVEDAPLPARSVLNFPKDGGFGRTNNGDGTFGNKTFNVPPVVEAADSAPFFHNNLSTTLDAVMTFYNGPQFNNPRAPAARFAFNATQSGQIVKFMRGINVLQNIQVARRELKEILDNQGDPRREQDVRLQTAFDETQDAIDVLNAGGIFPAAIGELTDARSKISQAQVTTNANQRRTLVQQAITELNSAQTSVATIAP